MSDKHIRVAVLGNVDAGKSTFIGTQVSGKLDDGRGSCRSVVMKHKHEIESGRTSTIDNHSVYLAEDATQLVPTSKRVTERDMVLKAARIISFMDLAGHEKYLRTTVAGVSEGMADYALVLVDGSKPPNKNHMTLHHLRLCAAMNIPVIVVLTKVDRAPPDVLRATLKQTQIMLRDNEAGLRPFCVKCPKDIATVVNKVSTAGLTPIVSVSCVTGEGLDMLRKMLLGIPQRRQHSQKQRQKPFEFLVHEILHVTGVGTVLSGFVSRGEWSRGQAIQIGPLKDGSTVAVTPKSAHVCRTSVDHVWAGHSVCFAVTLPRQVASRTKFTKNMVATKELISLKDTFEAQISLVRGRNTTLTKDRSCVVAHLLHNKQSVKITGIHNSQGEPEQIIRPGESAKVTFQFMKGDHYVRSGMRVILREGHVRGYGVVI
jgi:elongation factor 1-alpha